MSSKRHLRKFTNIQYRKRKEKETTRRSEIGLKISCCTRSKITVLMLLCIMRDNTLARLIMGCFRAWHSNRMQTSRECHSHSSHYSGVTPRDDDFGRSRASGCDAARLRSARGEARPGYTRENRNMEIELRALLRNELLGTLVSFDDKL